MKKMVLMSIAILLLVILATANLSCLPLMTPICSIDDGVSGAGGVENQRAGEDGDGGSTSDRTESDRCAGAGR